MDKMISRKYGMHAPGRDNAAGTDYRSGDAGKSCEGLMTDLDVKTLRERADSGFTLLEILVVIAILGLLIGLVAPAALRQLGGARVSVAKQSIARLGTVLDLYKLDVGSYPSSENGLDALVHKPADVESWNGPYIKDAADPKDPWGHPYSYQSPSSRDGHDYDLCSGGPHGNGQASPGQTDAICNP